MLQFRLQFVKCFTETLEMRYLALTQEFYHVIDIGIVGKTKNIVICRSCFLLCCTVARTTF